MRTWNTFESWRSAIAVSCFLVAKRFCSATSGPRASVALARLASMRCLGAMLYTFFWTPWGISRSSRPRENLNTALVTNMGSSLRACRIGILVSGVTSFWSRVISLLFGRFHWESSSASAFVRCLSFQSLACSSWNSFVSSLMGAGFSCSTALIAVSSRTRSLLVIIQLFGMEQGSVVCGCFAPDYTSRSNKDIYSFWQLPEGIFSLLQS